MSSLFEDSFGYSLTLISTGLAHATALTVQAGGGTVWLPGSAASNALGAPGTLALPSTSAENFDDYPDDSSTTANVAMNGSITGRIDSEGDQDWFRVSLVAGQNYRIELKGVGKWSEAISWPKLSIFDDTSTLQAKTESSDSVDLRYCAETTGTYFLAAKSWKAGAYSLAITDLGADDYAGNRASTATLSPGGTLSGNIGFASDKDAFHVELSAGRIYAFALTGTTEAGQPALSNPNLALLDSNARTVARDTDSTPNARGALVFSSDTTAAHLLVASGNLATTGGYILTMTDIGVDDYASGAISSGTLTVNAPASGNIQYAGDLDAFHVHLTAGRIYAFELRGSTALGSGTLTSPYLDLLNSASEWPIQRLYNGPRNQFRFSSDTSEAYLLVASGDAATTGAYSLTMTEVGIDDYGGSPSTAGSLGVGASIRGEIQFSMEEDWLRIELTAGRLYEFSLVADATSGIGLPTPFIRFLNNEGEWVANSRINDTRTASLLRYSSASDASYYLCAMGVTGETGAYVLTATDIGSDDFLGSTATTGVLTVGETGAGAIQFTNDEDWFRIDLAAGHFYTFELMGRDSAGGTLANPELLLLDDQGAVIATDADSGTGNDARLIFTATRDGIHYLAAKQGMYYVEGGTYTLLASDLGADDFAGGLDTHGRLEAGGSIKGNIQIASEQDWFKIDLVAGNSYVFDLQGSPSGHGTLSDPALQLLDPSGNLLVSDLDGGVGYDARIGYTPTLSGTYFLAARGEVGGITGSYTLSAGLDDHAGGITTDSQLAFDTPLTGTIDYDDDQDWFALTLETGHSYSFTLEGRDSGGGTLVDPYLRLLDGNGLQLRYNQDGGLGWDARLSYVAATSGTYYLSAESETYSSEGGGTYTLRAQHLGEGYQATPAGDVAPLSGDPALDGLSHGSGWRFEGAQVLTYSFNRLGAAGLYLGGAWTETAKDAIRSALHAWEAVADLHFVEIDGGSSIEFNLADIALIHAGGSYRGTTLGEGIFPDPAYADHYLGILGMDRTDYPQPEGNIFLYDKVYDMALRHEGSVGYWTGLHELGHVLGLKHPFDDGANNRPTFGEMGIAAEDTVEWSSMSYTTSTAAGSENFPTTPMLFDILAIQRLYGVNSRYHDTDNTYYLADDGLMYTLWDTGGIDWLDAGEIDSGIELNLEAGSINRYGRLQNTTAIAYGVIIENARGGVGADALHGNASNNQLDGGPGADTLSGGFGHDTYFVDNRGDRIVELADQGTDNVHAALSWRLGANLEHLTLLGSACHSGSGNALANTLTGNAAGNILNGGSGADTLIGGAGNDTYVVDNPGDVIQETGADTNDTVRSWVDWSLGDNLENLILLGTKPLNGTGNALNNALTGNGNANVLNGGGGNDVLDGGSGNDTLTGGAGGDTFAFTTPLNALRNVDTLTDFSSGTDKIALSPTVFRDMDFSGSPGSDAFYAIGNVAHDASDRILYNSDTGALAYDADGTGPLAAVRFALLSGAPTLLHSDFMVGYYTGGTVTA